MKHFTFIFTFFVSTVFSACSDSEFSEKNWEYKAILITQIIDSNAIKTFKEWNFFSRGGDNWQKISGDSSRYVCRYYKKADTTFLSFYRPEKFIVDFPCNFVFDTSKYWNFELAKYNDTLVRIKGVNNLGRDKILTIPRSLNNLFISSDPFDKFAELSALKDSIGVFGISYRHDIGEFIQFYLSDEYILTYLPEDLKLKPKYRDKWLKEFKKGKAIKKNWNFRKLDKPIDNG